MSSEISWKVPCNNVTEERSTPLLRRRGRQHSSRTKTAQNSVENRHSDVPNTKSEFHIRKFKFKISNAISEVPETKCCFLFVMDSEISKMQTKIPPKNFSIESIVGLSERRSPEIDIENTISQDHSEDEDVKVRDGKMGYYFQQNRVPNFPFFMSYDKRVLSGFQGEQTGQEDLKRASPGSVRSEVDSDGVDDRPHGELFTS